jgi:hypothetical protein
MEIQRYGPLAPTLVYNCLNCESVLKVVAGDVKKKEGSQITFQCPVCLKERTFNKSVLRPRKGDM